MAGCEGVQQPVPQLVPWQGSLPLRQDEAGEAGCSLQAALLCQQPSKLCQGACLQLHCWLQVARQGWGASVRPPLTPIRLPRHQPQQHAPLHQALQGPRAPQARLLPPPASQPHPQHLVHSQGAAVH